MSTLARPPSTLTPPPHFAAISVSAACVFITFALLMRWKPLGRLEFLKPWLYLCAGIGFAAAFLTGWANNVDGWARSVPYVGAAVPVIVAAALLYIVLYDLWPRHQSTRTTEISALLLPSFAPAIGGSVGAALSTVISTIAVSAAGIIGTGLGV